MQINRLFKIVYILLENKVVTASSLAERFEVSQRTIYRDIETLSEAGIPVYMSKGKGGGISLLPDFVLNKAVLTEEEKSDILSSLQAVSAVSLLSRESALDKLDCMLGKTNSDWIEVDFSSWENSEKEAELFVNLKESIIHKKAVEFTYDSSRQEKLTRRVYPLKLVFKGQSWYLYGYCTLRNDSRFFKLRRINDLKMLDESFDMKAPKKLFDSSMMHNENDIAVTYKISKKMAFRVYDEMPDYKTDENGDFICKVKFPDIDTACTYIATFGPWGEIVSPENARNIIKERIQKSLERYL